MNDIDLLKDWWDSLTEEEQTTEMLRTAWEDAHRRDMERWIPMVDGEQHPAPNPDYDEIPF
jgi:hypothetical protein